MRKKLRKLLVTGTLVLGLSVGALAADVANMTDIEGHWAYSSISYCMENGLYQGVSETEFAPDIQMSRGMFVTVLGRMMEVDPEEYRTWYLGSLYSDLSADAYYAPYINWATHYGIVQGNGDGTFSPDAPVTREAMATMVVRFASVFNYEIGAVTDNVADYFVDAGDIQQWAQQSVESLRTTGLINGYLQEDGTYRFVPMNNATRAECATIFYRLSQAIRPYTGREIIEAEGFWLDQNELTLNIGDWSYLTVHFDPDETTNQTVTWVSSDPSVVSVQSGRLTAHAEGTATIYAYTYNGLSASCTVTVNRPLNLAYEGESYEDKCLRIFGEVLGPSGYMTYYDINDTSYLVTVEVPVWKFTDDTLTEKYATTAYIQVHRNLADTVKAIFTEIFNGSEKFPIKSVGGYYRDSWSEHDPGLAIDINPYENYYYNPRTGETVGGFWDPDRSPYSIPIDGDVENAFRKYGFTRGIYWRNGTKDYMHFSFFAT